MKLLLRWWLIFIIMIAATGVGIYFGGIELLQERDHTYISFGIVGTLLLASLSLGVRFHKTVLWNYVFNLRYYHYVSRTLIAMGLAGTILGFIFMFQGLSSVSEVTTSDRIEALLVYMQAASGTAFYTSLLGLVSAYILEYLCLLVEEYNET